MSAPDRFAGLISLAEIRHVPPEEWPQTPVGQVMVPLERLHTLSPDQGLSEALPLLADPEVDQLPIVEEGQLVGMLNHDALVRVIAVRQRLGMGERGETATVSASR
ncbi:MAG TPA: CBS domain-containing protein [Ktedonobacterales bacterium]